MRDQRDSHRDARSTGTGQRRPRHLRRGHASGIRPGRRSEARSAADRHNPDAPARSAVEPAATPRFAAVTLPEAAWRRSWIVTQLRRYCNPFAVLLAQLAPKRWAGVAGENTLAIYYELLTVCSERFPVYDAVFYEDEDPTEGDPIEARLEMGIPIDLLGLNDDEIQYGRSPTFGFIGYLMEIVEIRTQPGKFPMNLGESWRNIAELRPFYDKYIDRRWCSAPGRREWCGVWKPITALAEYVMHDTGNWMLDVSNQSAQENYLDGGYPPWTIEDILNCEREYKRARPVLNSIMALRDYVNARPGERLPFLASALTGDRQVRC